MVFCLLAYLKQEPINNTRDFNDFINVNEN
jgi:hypothetical protein